MEWRSAVNEWEPVSSCIRTVFGVCSLLAVLPIGAGLNRGKLGRRSGRHGGCGLREGDTGTYTAIANGAERVLGFAQRTFAPDVGDSGATAARRQTPWTLL